MKIADTISVNPGKKALGHSEVAASEIFRTNVLNASSEKNRINWLSAFFPTVGIGTGEIRKYMLPLRALMSTIMIVTGLTVVSGGVGSYPMAFGIISLVAGAMLALGFLTRPMMIGAAGFFAISTALSIRAGLPDLTGLNLLFGTVIFAIMGSGKYSIDFLLRGAVKKAIKSSKQKREEKRMGYKAFHYAK